MRLPILALAIAAFAIGTTEFVIMGVLPDVAGDLGITVSRAGLLVTGYALGVAIGAPVVAALTARWPAHATLVALMVVFIVGNMVSALAGSFAGLMAGRVIASFAHGSFFGRGAVVASELAPPEKRAGAVALMFTGLTLANVLGVPIGTAVRQTWGWRTTFWGVSAFGAIALVAVISFVPAITTSSSGGWSVLRDRRVITSLLATTLGFGGTFVAFTFITPILVANLGLGPHAITFVLLLYGVGITAGNMLGGKLADLAPGRSLVWILAALAAIELLLAAVLPIPIIGELAVVTWGVIAFAAVPGLQLGVVRAASTAPTIASTLNIAAFNLGNAGGAALGAMLLAHGVASRALPICAAVFAVLATAVASHAHRT